MVQFFQGRADPRDAALGGLSSALGQGLGQGLNTYFTNKALDDVANDPATKNLPLSEKFGALQKAVAPYGEAGQKFLEERMQYIQQEHQRGQLQQALKKVQESTKEGGSNLDTTLAALEAFAGIPGSERMAGQVLPMILQNANAQRLYNQGRGNQRQAQPQQSAQGFQQNPIPNQDQTTQEYQQLDSIQQQQGQLGQPRPTNYNIKTPQEMINTASEAAQITGDPNSYSQRLSELEAENKLAIDHKNYLESIASASGNISAQDMPFFMEVGETIPSNNPDQWFQNTMNKWAPIKEDFDKLKSTFIPGMGSGLLGRNRDEALKRLHPSIQDLVKKGQERQVRKFLTEEYLSPTEIEEAINPLSKSTETSLKNLPKGLFPPKKPEKFTGIGDAVTNAEKKQNPFSDYETVKEKSPKTMQTMQNRLADFFKNNVKDDTSLLVLRDYLWKNKDYDWRQIGPAINQAKQMGLKLSPTQENELAKVDSDPPIQSLPDIFQDWGRVLDVMRGKK